MSAVRISHLSLENVRVPVQEKQSGLYLNPTADVVNMAFPAAGVDPVGPDFKPAAWETDATGNPPTYYAYALVGPGGIVGLAPGAYDVWVQVVDSPEIPVKRAGHLTVF